MDLRALRYFIAVVEAGSLSRAAATMHVAEPALTAQVKKLESELGVQVLERSHTGVTATPVGLQLYQDARRLLSDAAAMRERIQRSAESPEGSVTLAVPLLLVTLLVGPLLVRLQSRYPRIRVFVLDDVSLMVQQAMVDGRADLGILVDAPVVRGLSCRPLAEEAIFLSGRDPDSAVPTESHEGHPTVRFDVAASLPLLMQSPRFAIRQAVERLAAERGCALNIAHEHDSTNVIRSLHLAGAGFTFSPASSATTEVPMPRTGWLVARVVEPGLVRRYHLAQATHRSVSPAAAMVAEELVRLVRELVAGGSWEALLP